MGLTLQPRSRAISSFTWKSPRDLETPQGRETPQDLETRYGGADIEPASLAAWSLILEHQLHRSGNRVHRLLADNCCWAVMAPLGLESFEDK